jgi:WD40 repeat protein
MESKINIALTELEVNERNKELVPNATLKGHTNAVDQIAFSPTDSSKLASGSHDHTVKLWDLNKMKEIRSVEPHRFVFPGDFN